MSDPRSHLAELGKHVDRSSIHAWSVAYVMLDGMCSALDGAVLAADERAPLAPALELPPLVDGDGAAHRAFRACLQTIQRVQQTRPAPAFLFAAMHAYKKFVDGHGLNMDLCANIIACLSRGRDVLLKLTQRIAASDTPVHALCSHAFAAITEYIQPPPLFSLDDLAMIHQSARSLAHSVAQDSIAHALLPVLQHLQRAPVDASPLQFVRQQFVRVAAEDRRACMEMILASLHTRIQLHAYVREPVHTYLLTSSSIACRCARYIMRNTLARVIASEVMADFARRILDRGVEEFTGPEHDAFIPTASDELEALASTIDGTETQLCAYIIAQSTRTSVCILNASGKQTPSARVLCVAGAATDLRLTCVMAMAHQPAPAFVFACLLPSADDAKLASYLSLPPPPPAPASPPPPAAHLADSLCCFLRSDDEAVVHMIMYPHHAHHEDLFAAAVQCATPGEWRADTRVFIHMMDAAAALFTNQERDVDAESLEDRITRICQSHVVTKEAMICRARQFFREHRADPNPLLQQWMRRWAVLIQFPSLAEKQTMIQNDVLLAMLFAHEHGVHMFVAEYALRSILLTHLPSLGRTDWVAVLLAAARPPATTLSPRTAFDSVVVRRISARAAHAMEWIIIGLVRSIRATALPAAAWAACVVADLARHAAAPAPVALPAAAARFAVRPSLAAARALLQAVAQTAPADAATPAPAAAPAEQAMVAFFAAKEAGVRSMHAALAACAAAMTTRPAARTVGALLWSVASLATNHLHPLLRMLGEQDALACTVAALSAATSAHATTFGMYDQVLDILCACVTHAGAALPWNEHTRPVLLTGVALCVMMRRMCPDGPIEATALFEQTPQEGRDLADALAFLCACMWKSLRGIDADAMQSAAQCAEGIPVRPDTLAELSFRYIMRSMDATAIRAYGRRDRETVPSIPPRLSSNPTDDIYHTLSKMIRL
jgi:hypothetical protein